MLRRCLILLLAGCAPAPSADAAPDHSAATTVYVVRHAERVTEEGNASLSALGLARAAVLQELTRSVPIEAVWVTEFCRTAQMADPIAAARGLPLRVAAIGSRAGGLEDCTPPIRAEVSVLPEPTPAGALAELIRRDWGGHTVLVVGHSNTVPTIIEALGAPSLCGTYLPATNGNCQMAHDAFGDLFIVRIAADGTATVDHLRLDPA